MNMAGLLLAGRRVSSLSRKVTPAPCELPTSIQLKPGSATDIPLMSPMHRRDGGCDYFVLIADDVELLEKGLKLDV